MKPPAFPPPVCCWFCANYRYSSSAHNYHNIIGCIHSLGRDSGAGSREEQRRWQWLGSRLLVLQELRHFWLEHYQHSRMLQALGDWGYPGIQKNRERNCSTGTDYGGVRTVIKYSTARSGLLKLARMARRTCSLGNPISTMLLMVSCKADPERNDEVSPKARGCAGSEGGAAAGTSEDAAAAGADSVAGGATGAGAAGAGALEVVAAGVGLGYPIIISAPSIAWSDQPHTLETIRTKKSFSLIPHDSIVLSSANILPKWNTGELRVPEGIANVFTRVDDLL